MGGLNVHYVSPWIVSANKKVEYDVVKYEKNKIYARKFWKTEILRKFGSFTKNPKFHENHEILAFRKIIGLANLLVLCHTTLYTC